jgi:DNA helicase INO80
MSCGVQAVKNSASQRWKTLLGFNCRNRLLLTGTPIQNSMAELWALLHFIMPELFDSFSDFTEWFSKDIESSAEGKGSGLDSAQLKRLQLILQPFMLRRTKKDVLDELVQKVEVEMRTPLSNRQKYYYEVLKKRVTSTAELLDRNMLSKDDKRLHSLMNLVMQFRKVCNHPEIFERRDFQSPLQMRDYVLPALPPPPTEAVVVNVINHNPIQLSIPALVFDDVAAHTSWSRLNASARTRILTTLLRSIVCATRACRCPCACLRACHGMRMSPSMRVRGSCSRVRLTSHPSSRASIP